MVLLFRILSRLPLWLVHLLGGWLGRLTYLLSPTYRRNLQGNMAQAGIDPALHAAAAAEAG
jgi:KDO2-lipid IV(A) lauroyltransferase